MSEDDGEYGEFSVHQFFADGTSERVLSFVDASTAVRRAKRLTETVGARLGTTVRVVITDGGDCCCFEWMNGELTFPRAEKIGERQIDAGNPRLSIEHITAVGGRDVLRQAVVKTMTRPEYARGRAHASADVADRDDAGRRLVVHPAREAGQPSRGQIQSDRQGVRQRV